MRRKIAAILAADIAGYSRLIAEDEEEAVRRLAAYREVFDDFIQRYGGRIFNTAGDSVLAEFPSAVDALRCAIDVQETLRTRNLAYPPSRQMAFRMGMTIGDVIEREGDLLGDGVNIAARLQTLSKPGSICLSKAVYDAVANKLSVRYADMGAQEVKNIPYPVHAFSVAVSERAAAKSASTQGEQVYEQERPQAMKLAGGLAAALAAGALVAFLATKFVGPSPGPADSGGAPKTTSEKPVTSEVTASKTSEGSGRITAPAEARTTPVEVTPPIDGAKQGKLQQKAPDSGEVASTGDAVDVAATMRRRKARWSECNSTDAEKALESCGALTREAGIGPNDLSAAYRMLALAYRKSGKLDDAVGSYTKSIETVANAEAYDGRGISYLLKNEPNTALKDFDRAIALDDKSGEAFNNRAWTYYKLGKSQEALEDANKAVGLIPDRADAWDTRAHINEFLGKRKEALEDYEKALAIDGTLQSALQGSKRLKAD